MGLKGHVLLALKGTSRQVRKEIADELKITEPTFYRWVSNNDDNLTKAACLVLISKAIGVGADQLVELSPQEMN